MDESPIAVAVRLHDALAAGAHGDDLRPLFTSDATSLEHPNRLNPQGAHSSLEQIIAASSAGAGLLLEQHYDVHHAVESDDLAILRVTWRGVIGRDVGPFHEGQELVAHLAQFVTVRHGRIRGIETFDCYEPF